MKSFLAVLLITLGLSFSLSAQEHTKRAPRVPPTSTPTPPNPGNVSIGTWTKYSSETGRFSVLMPGIPTEEVKTVPSQHGPYTTHLFILRQTKTVFLIGWVDYDPSFNFNRQTELEMNRDNFIKGIEARLLDSRHVTIDGYSAIEFTAETQQRTFRSRVYMVGRRPYQIVIGSPKGDEDSVNVNRFLDSFKVSLN